MSSPPSSPLPFLAPEQQAVTETTISGDTASTANEIASIPANAPFNWDDQDAFPTFGDVMGALEEEEELPFAMPPQPGQEQDPLFTPLVYNFNYDDDEEDGMDITPIMGLVYGNIAQGDEPGTYVNNFAPAY